MSLEEVEKRIEEFRRSGGTGLDLSRLGLAELPPALFEPEIAGRLETLYLGYNFLTALPDRIGDLARLTSLYLNHNPEMALPDRIGDLTNLTSLNLRDTYLRALPDRIGDLANLTSLDLSHNGLTALPDRLFDLANLTSLDLSGNGLTALPDRISDLKELRNLDFAVNEIPVLPAGFADLPESLEYKADGNPLRSPPLKTVLRGQRNVRRYFSLRESGRWPLRSDHGSLALERPTWLGFAEVAGMSCLSAYLIAEGITWLFWSGATVAPLLLLRSDSSTGKGVDWFRKLFTRLSIRGNDPAILLPGKLIALGLGSLGIKIAATLRFGSVLSIPANFRRQLFVLDMASPPELVPGIEDAYPAHAAELITPTDLFTDFRQDPMNFGVIHLRRFLHQYPFLRPHPLVKPTGLACLFGFYAFAWAYRLNLKASCLVYWPFLLFHRDIADEDIRERALETKPADNILKKSPLVLFIGHVGLFGLADLLSALGMPRLSAFAVKHTPAYLAEIQEIVTGFIAGFAGAPPLAWLYAGCVALAGFYFASAIMDYALSSRNIARDEVWNRGDTRFLLRLAQAFRVLQNAAIAAVTAYFFVWAGLRLPETAEGLWAFLSG